MIISRTPFRMSFFGGGTDYPKWFERHGGAVLATTINKYCYITCRYLPPFFEHKSRIIYSKMEHVSKIDDIDHPAVRECLRFLKIRKGVEIHHDGDLPARTGLGSSSSFTVGLLRSLYALKGEMVSREQLAREAIHVEQDLCDENVGCQDQTCAAFGGLNYIEFGGHDHLKVTQVTIDPNIIGDLENHIMLYFTGFSRNASEIAGHQIKMMDKKENDLLEIQQMVPHALGLLQKHQLKKFGQLLHESWMIKRQLSGKVTTPVVDAMYEAARSGGALGGKLLGAGGGGFLMLFVPPRDQPTVRLKLKKWLLVPVKFEGSGSQVIFYQPNGEYSG
jgi:D-glycero-alpha-D-manno-heptose-7-phosphate kinase